MPYRPKHPTLLSVGISSHKPHFARIPSFLFILVTICLSSSASDRVNTTRDSYSGRASINRSKLSVNRKNIPWKRVINLVSDNSMSLTAPNALLMRNGEIWRCTLLELDRSKLKIRIAPFGTQDIDAQLVSSIEFLGKSAHPGAGTRGCLYRRNAGPITGRITALNSTSLQISSTLGTFNLPRQQALRYVVELAAPPPVATTDEIALINGSLFRGTLSLSGDSVAIQHPVLGTTNISQSAILHLRRYDQSWSTVAPSSWAIQTSSTPLAIPTQPQPCISFDHSTSRWMEGLDITANTTVTTTLPHNRQGLFAANILLNPKSPPARIEILSANRILSSQILDTPSKLTPWRFKFNATDKLTLRITFADKVRLPCSARLCDPIIVWK